MLITEIKQHCDRKYEEESSYEVTELNIEIFK